MVKIFGRWFGWLLLSVVCPVAGLALYRRFRQIYSGLADCCFMISIISVVLYAPLGMWVMYNSITSTPSVYYSANSGSTTIYDYPIDSSSGSSDSDLADESTYSDNKIGLDSSDSSEMSSGGQGTAGGSDSVPRIVLRATSEGVGSVHRFLVIGGVADNVEEFEDVYERILTEEEVKEVRAAETIYFEVYGDNASCSIEIDGVERNSNDNTWGTDEVDFGYAICVFHLT